MNRMLRMLAALAVGTMVALTAGAQAPEKKKITIAVGGKNLFYYLPLSVAERKGYFKDEGLEVEIPDFAGGAKALQALVGGSADMVSGAYEHTINMAAKKQPIKAVVLQAKYSSIVLLLPKDKAAKYKGPADLKGLKVGVSAPGSSTNMFVNNILAKGGFKPTDIAVVGVGTGSGAFAAMEKGEIDVNETLKKLVDEDIQAGNRELEEYERIRKYMIVARRFTELHGEMTPTLKVKRNVVFKNFEKEIKGLYQK